MSWKRVRLRDLGTWYGGGTPSKANPSFWTGGSIPWLSPKDMGAEILTGTQDHVTRAAIAESSAKLVPAGSVAVVTRSGILERTIPVALVPFDTTMNQDMKAVVPRSDIDARWIAWGLRAFERNLLSDTRKAGTTVASIEMPRWYNFELPVPPLPEQRRIVAILEEHLSHLDAAERYLAKSLSRLNSLKHIMLDSHFGAKDNTIYFAEAVQGIAAGKSYGSSNAPARSDEWGIIKVSAMTWGQFRPDENKAIPADRADPRFEIQPGDLLVSRANTADYVGASVLVGEVRPQLLLSDKSLRVIPKPGIDPQWLWRCLQSPSARAQITALATGTKDSMRNISQASLRSIQIPHHEPERQRRTVASFDKFAAQAVVAQSQIVDAQLRSAALRRSLLSAAFSGRLTGSSKDVSVAAGRVDE